MCSGKAIKEKLNIKVVSPNMTELFHGIRSQLSALLDGLDPKDLATMSLGLSHSLSRCAIPCNCASPARLNSWW